MEEIKLEITVNQFGERVTGILESPDYEDIPKSIKGKLWREHVIDMEKWTKLEDLREE